MSSTSVKLAWSPPPSDQHNGIILGYNVSITTSEMDNVLKLSTNATKLTVDSLKPYTTYACNVAAFTSVGVGPYGDQLQLTTLQAGEWYYNSICQFKVSETQRT